MADIQYWANLATIVSFVIAAISLGVSLRAKKKVNSLKIEINKIKEEVNIINFKNSKMEMNKIEGATSLSNPNIGTLNIFPAPITYPKAEEGEKNE